MNPKPINDNEVRMTDISVRSALMRVRWNDMPVRRDESSVDMSLPAQVGGARSDCAAGLPSLVISSPFQSRSRVNVGRARPRRTPQPIRTR